MLDFHVTQTFRHYIQKLSNHPTQTVECQQMNGYFEGYMVLMPARQHFSLVILTIMSATVSQLYFILPLFYNNE